MGAPEAFKSALPVVGSRESCTCAGCVACCERKPGWFKPGEAEKVADFLGVSLPELFATRLEADFWINTDRPSTLVLAPAIVGKPAGEIAGGSFWHGGRCVFLTAEGRCEIHPVKPFECGVAWCGDGPVEFEDSAHGKAARAWDTPEHQAQVGELLQLSRSPRSVSDTAKKERDAEARGR